MWPIELELNTGIFAVSPEELFDLRWDAEVDVGRVEEACEEISDIAVLVEADVADEERNDVVGD